MTNNNNYKKTILTALLIAPLLTAGVTVGNLQQANAVPVGEFDVLFVGLCGPFAPSILSMTVGASNVGGSDVLLNYEVIVMNSGGAIIFSDDSVTDVFLVPGAEFSVDYFAGLEEADTYFASATVTVEDEALGIGIAEQIRLYPNPAHESLFIELSGITSTELEIKMFTVSGSQVLTSSRINSKSIGLIELDLENLNPGIYLLKLRNQEEIITKNILVR